MTFSQTIFLPQAFRHYNHLSAEILSKSGFDIGGCGQQYITVRINRSLQAVQFTSHSHTYVQHRISAFKRKSSHVVFRSEDTCGVDRRCHLFFSKRPKCGPCQPCAQENTLHGVNNNTLQQRQTFYYTPLTHIIP